MLLLLILSTTVGVTPAQSPPTEEKPVCRVERTMGSRVAKQVCRTASETQREAEEARRKLGLGNRNPAPPAAFKAPKGN